ncbi:hypothetical protein WFK62_13665 [Yersinia enterocolitica]|nr:hypothetical protein [Yersinia enterocolitica]EKN3589106.1 hypothetical protein [Yersinia enterocolitica]EKN4735725.1 hypothetical protein [Yersinia enterocolitica]EMB6557412.1 hypothetical protein [Yersinia enterocolitica]HEM6604568.1 hypothetical protein [Yersinia enterocolitica]
MQRNQHYPAFSASKTAQQMLIGTLPSSLSTTPHTERYPFQRINEKKDGE